MPHAPKTSLERIMKRMPERRARALSRPAIAFPLLLLAGAAVAHPGHGDGGFAAGFVHPFLGADHLLAMVAMGLWIALLPGPRARVAAGAGLLGLMVAGVLVGAFTVAAGTPVPAVLESALASTVVASGALLALHRGVRRPIAFAVLGACALLHGFAHGAEAFGSSLAAFGGGFLAATVVLQSVGLVAGSWLARTRALGWRVAGTAIGAAGVVLLASRL